MQIPQQLGEIQALIKDAHLTCVDLVQHYLDKIEQTADLNAYVEVYTSEALAKAKQLDEQFLNQSDSMGKLWGMVIGIKDVLSYKGHKINAGSRILDGYEALYSATAIERLLAEDAIIIGRLNCDEFGMGSSNENSVFGPVKNGLDPTKVPGGSSGGSAVAVQTNTCLAALGTDTGGSVRQPAAFCGVVGMKPSYGRISRHGLLAYASSFDQIGVLGHSVEDIALLLEIMAGPDSYDSTASKQAVPAYSKELNFSGKVKIAYFEEAFEHDGLDGEIKEANFRLIEDLRKAGHQVEGLSFDLLDFLVPAYYVLTTAEASSNLSRYDGIRFGYRSEEAKNLEETYRLSRTEGFGEEVKRRIMLGTFVLSAGYFDAYYGKAQKIRRLIFEQTMKIFEDYDFILMPSSPTAAFNIGEKIEDPVAIYLADIFTIQANMTGVPAISLPLGKLLSGLPFGIQIMAKSFNEASLLAFSGFLLKEYCKGKTSL